MSKYLPKKNPSPPRGRGKRRPSLFARFRKAVSSIPPPWNGGGLEWWAIYALMTAMLAKGHAVMIPYVIMVYILTRGPQA